MSLIVFFVGFGSPFMAMVAWAGYSWHLPIEEGISCPQGKVPVAVSTSSPALILFQTAVR